MDQLCDTGLVLSLGGFSSNTPSKLPAAAPPTTASCDFKLLLTLGLSGTTRSSPRDQLGRNRKIDASNDSGDLHRQGSSQSGASSLSNSSAKRGREFGGSEEYLDGEKVCFRGSDEEEEGSSARKKLRLTKEQSALLEEHFKRHSTLNPKQKQALARGLNLRTRQVEVWFQNRRARTKLKQTELDCEALKKCCEALRDENARLQKEVQELKALMQSQRTSCMKLPAATLATCPSCDRMAGGNGSSGGGDNSSSSTKTAMGFKMAAKPHFFNAFANSSAAC